MKISRFVFAIMLAILIVLGVRSGFDNRRERKESAEVEDSASLASNRGGTASAGRANLFDLKRDPPAVLEGIPVTGSPHLIKSPYATDGPLVDVQGIAAGTKIECPTTRRPFLVPEGMAKAEPESPSRPGAEMADSNPPLFTRRYQMPRFFPSIHTSGAGGDSALAEDPFAERGTDQAIPPPSAMEILESKGIVFEDGATAFYVPASSELVVRNTKAQLDIVDKFVLHLTEEGVPKIISGGSRFVETQ